MFAVDQRQSYAFASKLRLIDPLNDFQHFHGFFDSGNGIAVFFDRFHKIPRGKAVVYAVIRLIEKNIFRVFGKDALYTRIEDSLSEIFMTYCLKKDSKSGEKNNG